MIADSSGPRPGTVTDTPSPGAAAVARYRCISSRPVVRLGGGDGGGLFGERGGEAAQGVAAAGCPGLAFEPGHGGDANPGLVGELFLDRKSTRLNSSHRCISYAVFC